MTKEEKNQLELEIQHIFDSGANEIRVFEMINRFVERRSIGICIDFEQAVKPAIEWLAKNGDPNTRIIVSDNKAELMQGQKSFLKH
jgi:hypothetical protein